MNAKEDRHEADPRSSLRVVAWPDEIIDSLGLDPRSTYVEKFWLGVIGPSTTWLLRHMADELEAHPGGFELELEETARRLGLGHQGGRNSPFSRTLTRMAQFGLASSQGPGVLGVRRKVPPLNLRQLRRLTPALQAEHYRWQQDQLAVSPDKRRERRAIQLALSLVELGEDREATVRQLVEWRYHPEVAEKATRWAWDRHGIAQEAADRRAELRDELGQAPTPRSSGAPEFGGSTSGSEHREDADRTVSPAALPPALLLPNIQRATDRSTGSQVGTHTSEGMGTTGPVGPPSEVPRWGPHREPLGQSVGQDDLELEL